MRYDMLIILLLSLALGLSLQVSMAIAGQSAEAAQIDREADAALKKLRRSDLMTPSDGICVAVNRSDQKFGREHLCEEVRRGNHLGLRPLLFGRGT